MTINKTLYHLLKLPKTATPKEIKNSYLLLAKQYHPDNKQSGNDDHFKLITNAYKILSDPIKRAEYDSELLQEQFKDHPFFKKQQEFNNKQDKDNNKEDEENNNFGFSGHKGVRNIELTKEEQEQLINLLKKRKREGKLNQYYGSNENNNNTINNEENTTTASMNNTHSNKLSQQEKAKVRMVMMRRKKSILPLIGAIVFAFVALWGFKMITFYNYYYKNLKDKDIVIDVVHPLANSTERDGMLKMEVPKGIEKMLIQHQTKEYQNANYYKAKN
ncbi:hypothetical protein ABK040_005597 [Willaertia magna]